MNPLPLSRGISRHPVGSRFGAYEFKAVQRENVFPWFNVSGCDLQGTWFKSEKISSLPCLRTLQLRGCHTYLLVISVDQTWVLTTHWLPLLVASWILHSWNTYLLSSPRDIRQLSDPSPQDKCASSTAPQSRCLTLFCVHNLGCLPLRSASQECINHFSLHIPSWVDIPVKNSRRRSSVFDSWL